MGVSNRFSTHRKDVHFNSLQPTIICLYHFICDWMQTLCTCTYSEREFVAHLIWCGYEINGSVVAVILLSQAEGELVVYQQSVCMQEAQSG